MRKKTPLPVKKIQRSSGHVFVLIPVGVMEELGWKAQNENCKVAVLSDKARHRVILQRVTFDEPSVRAISDKT